jgi:hypothetical protein
MLLSLRSNSAYLGDDREAFEMVALSGESVGEVAGMALVFEPMVNNHSTGREPTLETVGGALHAGLVRGDVPVVYVSSSQCLRRVASDAVRSNQLNVVEVLARRAG